MILQMAYFDRARDPVTTDLPSASPSPQQPPSRAPLPATPTGNSPVPARNPGSSCDDGTTCVPTLRLFDPLTSKLRTTGGGLP
jgi:hypothetical protein